MNADRKYFEDEKMQALLEENNTQMQQELAKAFHVDQFLVIRCRHGMGMAQKLGNWMQCELTESRMKCQKIPFRNFSKATKKLLPALTCIW